ncbi:hypothetical protein ACVWWI_007041 [Bradyrhizobium sp. USDA 3686]
MVSAILVSTAQRDRNRPRSPAGSAPRCRRRQCATAPAGRAARRGQAPARPATARPWHGRRLRGPEAGRSAGGDLRGDPRRGPWRSPPLSGVSAWFCCRKLAPCGTSGKGRPNRLQIRPPRCHKVEKNVPTALSKGTPGWYIPPAPNGLCPGLPSKEAFGTDEASHANSAGPSFTVPGAFTKAKQRLTRGGAAR